MRKLYIICFVTLTTLFVTCYCIGYYAVTKKNRVEQPANDYYEMRAAAAADEKRIMCKVIAVSSSGFSPIISLP